jgi:preprotein translocase subunit SecE
LQLIGTEVQQHPSKRQKSGYFGVIAIVTIVTLGLCWGFAHI